MGTVAMMHTAFIIHVTNAHDSLTVMPVWHCNFKFLAFHVQLMQSVHVAVSHTHSAVKKRCAVTGQIPQLSA